MPVIVRLIHSSKAKNLRRPEQGGEQQEESGVDKIHSTSSFSHSLIFGIGLKRRIKYR